MDIAVDLRLRTTLVCGALALAIAISSLLGTRIRRRHALFAAFAADVGLWYLSQSLFGFYQASLWARLRVALPVLLPPLVVNLFEAVVPDEGSGPARSRAGRFTVVLALPTLALVLATYPGRSWVRGLLVAYAVAVVAWGLVELSRRGRNSRSRATRRRVSFLVMTGAFTGAFTLVDLGWVLGYASGEQPPPVGVVLSIIFLFVLAQGIRNDRLLDLYELIGRLVVATAVSFLIAGLFYVLVTVVGQFNTMWLNAIVVAIVVLVLFNPLRDWTELQVQRYVLRERRNLETALGEARRRLAHVLEVDELSEVVMRALDESRSVTTAALYFLSDDGSTLERRGALGTSTPPRIDVASASALLDQLHKTPVVLEELARGQREGRPVPRHHVAGDAVLAAAAVLGPLSEQAVALGIRADEGELVGVLILADERIGDAFSPEDIALFEQLASQIGAMVVSSRVYLKMKERDRLAVLGQMAAGLAHEIRNPLGAIKGAAQLLADPGPDASSADGPSREFVGIILEEVERLDRVVGSVLDLARESPGAVPPIDVNGVIRRTLQVLAAEWGEAPVAVVEELDDSVPRVAIPPEQLRQVLINLLRNAGQAVRGRGRIGVRTRLRVRERPHLGEDGVTNLVAERHVVIGVTDDGPGIPQSVLKNLFLPFFTTKERGTGLGLAISQRIVQGVAGRIEVRTREGEGTTFELVLPAAMEALGTPMPPAVEPATTMRDSSA
jgi:signal transduction histidine kinase